MVSQWFHFLPPSASIRELFLENKPPEAQQSKQLSTYLARGPELGSGERLALPASEVHGRAGCMLAGSGGPQLGITTSRPQPSAEPASRGKSGLPREGGMCRPLRVNARTRTTRPH